MKLSPYTRGMLTAVALISVGLVSQDVCSLPFCSGNSKHVSAYHPKRSPPSAESEISRRRSS